MVVFLGDFNVFILFVIMWSVLIFNLEFVLLRIVSFGLSIVIWKILLCFFLLLEKFLFMEWEVSLVFSFMIVDFLWIRFMKFFVEIVFLFWYLCILFNVVCRKLILEIFGIFIGYWKVRKSFLWVWFFVESLSRLVLLKLIDLVVIL